MTKSFSKISGYLQKVISSPVSRVVLIVTLFTLFSRVLGFIRQFLIYSKLDKLDSDLILAANKIPELISVTLLMGTVYSSVLPIASKLEDKNDEKISGYLHIINLSLVLVLLVITGFSFLFTQELLLLTTSQELVNLFKQEGLFETYILITRILLAQPIIFALQAILGVFLTIKKRFLVYSLAGVIANLGTILGILIAPKDNLGIIVIGMLAGGVACNLLYFQDAKKYGLKIYQLAFSKTLEIWKEFKAEIAQTWKLFLPRIFIIDGFYASTIVINTLIQYDGQVTAFDLGTSIQGAFFIIVSSLGTIIFPDLTKLFQNSDSQNTVFWQKFWKYTRLSLLLGVGVTLAALIGSPLIMNLYKVLGSGQGTEDYVIQIAQLSALSLLFRSVREVWSKYFFVRQRQWQPVTLSLFGIFAISVTSVALVKANGFDAGLAVSVGLIAYNFAWCLLAGIYILNDRLKLAHTS